MGALYAFVEVRSDVLPDFDDQAFALDLLENKHVLVAPGVSFNVPYRNCFRITNLPEPQVLAHGVRADRGAARRARGRRARAADRRFDRPSITLSSGARRVPLGLIEAANAGCTVLAPERRARGGAVRCDRARAPRLGPRAVADAARARFRQLARGAARSAPVRRTRSTPRCLTDVEERELWRAVVLESASGRQFLEPSGAARAARARAPGDLRIRHPVRAVADYGTEESPTLLDWIERFAQRCRALGCISADRVAEDRRPNAHLRRAHRRAHRVDRKSGLAAGRPALAARPRRCAAAAVGRRERAVRRALLQGGVARRRTGGDRGVGAVAICRRCRTFAPGSAFLTLACAAPNWWTHSTRRSRRSASRSTAPRRARLTPSRAAHRSPSMPPVRAALEPAVGRRGSGSVRAVQRPAARSGFAGGGGGSGRGGAAGRGLAPPRAERSDARGVAGALPARRQRREAGPGRRTRATARRGADSRGAARQSSDEPLDRAVDTRLRSRPVELARIAGRAPSINPRSAFANCWRRSRPADRPVRRAVAPLGREHPAARGARYGISSADRNPAHLGQRAIDRSVARLRRAVGHRMQRGALAAAGRSRYRCCRCRCNGNTE